MKLTTDILPVLRLEWSYTSAPPLYLHKVDRENFINCLLCIQFLTTLAFQWLCTTWVTFTLFIRTCVCVCVWILNIWSLVSVYMVLFMCLTSTVSYNFTLYMHNCIRLCILLLINVWTPWKWPFKSRNISVSINRLLGGPTTNSELVGLIYKIWSHIYPGLVLNLYFMSFWFKHLLPIYIICLFALC